MSAVCLVWWYKCPWYAYLHWSCFLLIEKIQRKVLGASISIHVFYRMTTVFDSGKVAA